ncbi:IS110 family transposase [Streptomyces netropsis]|uniref:IS110 family transposase n=1 Tax=Streptomyces netropsis TaxID=55404 RepID=UPI003BB0563B
MYWALDAGKSEHRGTALLRDGRTTFDKPLPNNEPQLRQLFTRLKSKGKVLVVVDQPASIGTLAVTVARAYAARERTTPTRHGGVAGEPPAFSAVAPLRRVLRRPAGGERSFSCRQ